MGIFVDVTNGMTSDASHVQQLINEFKKAVSVAEFSEATTMTGTVTLADTNLALQRFICNGANRIVKLPALATTNHLFFIVNVTGAAYTLDVQSNGGVSLLQTPLADGQAVLVVPDGAAGYKIPIANSPAQIPPNNFLINGGFDYAQRQATPGTLTTYAANTYSADRWKTYAENASYQYQQTDGTGETGLTSQYFGQFKKITNAGKLLIYQILEGRNAVALRGKQVIFQCQMKASAAKTIRMGIFELQTAGTIDAVPSPIVTAAGANSTDPTMGTNVAIITAAQSKSVTTSMQTFSVVVTVPATSKNLICAVWTDSQFSINDILYIAEAGLYTGAIPQSWVPKLAELEYANCLRYYERMYFLTASASYPPIGFAYANNAAILQVPCFPKRTSADNVLSVSAAGDFTFLGAVLNSISGLTRLANFMVAQIGQAGTSWTVNTGGFLNSGGLTTGWLAVENEL